MLTHLPARIHCHKLFYRCLDVFHPLGSPARRLDCRLPACHRWICTERPPLLERLRVAKEVREELGDVHLGLNHTQRSRGWRRWQRGWRVIGIRWWGGFSSRHRSGCLRLSDRRRWRGCGERARRGVRCSGACCSGACCSGARCSGARYSGRRLHRWGRLPPLPLGLCWPLLGLLPHRRTCAHRRGTTG